MSRALPNARWTFRSVCTMEDYGLWRVNGPVVAPAKARGRVRLLLINLVGIERLVGIGEHELRAAVLALHRAVEAGVPSGVAGAAGLLDANPHRVLIAIHPHLDNALDMTRRLTFAPQLLARAAEVPGVAGLDGPAQRLVERRRDLRGEMLLRLQPMRECIDEARNLRQPDDAIDRRIGDVRLAVERHDVMLAMRMEFDVADQHKIVVARGLAEGAVQHLGRALVVALKQLVISLDHAAGRVEQAFALGIFADIGEQRLHRVLGLVARGARLVRVNPRLIDLGSRNFDLVQLAAQRLDDSIHTGSPFDRPFIAKDGGRSVTGSPRGLRATGRLA